MKARFIGDPLDGFSGPSVMQMFGEEFPKGQWINVTNDHASMKIRTNRHFECDGDEIASDGSMIAAPAEKKQNAQIEDERADLMAQAEAMGISVDGRWGIARLRSEVSAKRPARDR